MSNFQIIKNWLSQKRARRCIRRHLMQQLPADFLLHDGIPDGCSIYSISRNEPCWTAWIPSKQIRVGATRLICVSKQSGKVIYDGQTGE